MWPRRRRGWRGGFTWRNGPGRKAWRWSADVAVIDAGTAAAPRLLEIDAGAPGGRRVRGPGLGLAARFLQSGDRTAPYVGAQWL